MEWKTDSVIVMIQEQKIDSVKSEEVMTSINPLDLLPIKEYVLGDQTTSFIIKNNLFVSIEELRIDDKGFLGPLSSTDTQILTTCFLMAHQLNENRQHYDSETVFKIDLKNFYRLWNIEVSEEEKKTGLIYHNIKNSISRLQSRMFLYMDLESNTPVQSSYFAYIEYGKSTIKFGFPKPFIQYLRRMDKFTWYYFENILRIQSDTKQFNLTSYAVTLYENLQKEKNFALINEDGKKVIIFSLTKLRKLFGLQNSYQRNIDFKNKLLVKVLDLIERHTQLKVELEGIREGKEFERYKFICDFPARDLDFALAVSKEKDSKMLMSAPQRKKFAKLLAEHVGFHSVYQQQNEPTKTFISRIEKKLMGNLNLVEFWPYLKEVGCKSRKIEKFVMGSVQDEDGEMEKLKF